MKDRPPRRCGHRRWCRCATLATVRRPDSNGSVSLHLQAQGAACQWAQSRGERVAAEHLLVALIYQGTPGVCDALSRAGIDVGQVRRSVLTALGGPADLAAIALPPLTPAGTLDRPPLPITELPAEVWNQLRWRQDHMPLARLRSRSDWTVLHHLETKAAWRLATGAGVDDDRAVGLHAFWFRITTR